MGHPPTPSSPSVDHSTPGAFEPGASSSSPGDEPPPAGDRRLPRRRHLRRRPLGYLLAVLGPIIVGAAVERLGQPLASAGLGGLALAILGATYVGGVGPGVLATLVALPLGGYLLPPSGSLAVDAISDRIRLGVLALVGVTLSLALRRFALARLRAERAAADAERFAAELHTRVRELQRQSAESAARAERLQGTTREYELLTRALSGARDAADAEWHRVARLLGSIRDGFYTLDAEHRITYANDALLAMWRRRRDEVLGRVIWDLFPDTVGTRLHASTLKAQHDGEISQYEEYYAPLDIVFAVKMAPFEQGVSVVLRDVSARVRAERDLHSSEARYRALVEASTQMVWSTTADGQVEDMPFWRELTGQTVDEVRGSGWLDAIHPEDRPRVLERWRQTVASRASMYECRYRIRMRDGTHRWFHARGVPVLGEEGVREWVGVLLDIDAERRAEEGRLLLERASETLVSSFDVRSTLRSVVRLAVDGPTPLADLARVDLPDGKGYDCVAFESRDPALAAAYRALEAQYPVPSSSPIGFPHVIATGESELIAHFERDLAPALAEYATPHLARLREVDMYSGVCVPLRAAGRTLGALTLVLHGPERRRSFDESDLAIAEELGRRAGTALDNAMRFAATEEARREAEFANRAKAEFLAVMSHELRTPLNAISGYAELLLLELRGTLTDEQRDDIHRIQRSQHHLLALVNDVLNFAKLDAGRVELDIEEVSVASVLDGLDTLVAPQVAQKQLSYEVESCDPTLLVRADSEKLRQVLLNLLSNAVKATEPGGRISVRCRDAGAAVCIDVCDSGRGIPASKHERIFQPFVQLDRRLNSSHQGTGLGLAISRELARAMSGDLTVRSEVGMGSTFIVTLPSARG